MDKCKRDDPGCGHRPTDVDQRRTVSGPSDRNPVAARPGAGADAGYRRMPPPGGEGRRGGGLIVPPSPGTRPWTDQSMLIKFQQTLTLVGSSSSGDVEQPDGMWLDGLKFPTFHIKAEISALSNCTLVLESAATVEGPWSTVIAYTQVGDRMTVISSEGGDAKFSRFVRWKVAKGASDWFACFKFQAVPGKSTTDVPLTPRRT